MNPIEKELLLVKLPKVADLSQDFYGIGYYSDYGFMFVLLTEEILNKYPLRKLPFPDFSEYESSNHIEIIGSIKNPPKKDNKYEG